MDLWACREIERKLIPEKDKAMEKAIAADCPRFFFEKRRSLKDHRRIEDPQKIKRTRPRRL
jgi:hypothetical protein